MDKQQMIDAIYKKVETTDIYRWFWNDDFRPVVMIWDVIDWRDIKMPVVQSERILAEWRMVKTKICDAYRTKKRKPIEDQSDECISFIFSLIK